MVVMPRSHTQDGQMECLGVLLECVTSAREGRDETVSCASSFLAGGAGAEQGEQLLRVLSSVVALRGALLEQLEGQDAGAGVVEQALGERARSQAESEDKEEGRDEVSGAAE